MAYYDDSKHDDTMEAGLLSTHKEEERMLLKEALYQDEDPEPYMEPAPKNSPAKRILMALGICFLVGIAVVSIGSATGVCPGHLRHTSPTDVSVKDAVHRHNPNLSHAMGHMGKRQNTPSASETSASETSASETQQASEPASTNRQTTQAQETTSNAPASTEAAASTTAEPKTQATTQEAQSTEAADSSTDSGDKTTSEKATQSTITEGTKTTSSAVAKTLTSTRSDGGVVTFTSTSWVAVVPSSKATTTGNPDLQGAAAQYSVQGTLTAAIGMIFGALLLL